MLDLKIFQKFVTVFSSLQLCRQLYIFRVLTPIIRSWYSCNYSLCDLLQLFTTRSCNYSCASSWWWVSTPEICRAGYTIVMNWIQLQIFGKFLNPTCLHVKIYVYCLNCWSQNMAVLKNQSQNYNCCGMHRYRNSDCVFTGFILFWKVIR